MTSRYDVRGPSNGTVSVDSEFTEFDPAFGAHLLPIGTCSFYALTYDGQDFGFGCRIVSERWLTTGELENLAAFVLRAAAIAPGWGIEKF